jgi:glycosyltransferase involved in cell wall biosynthesis
MHSTAENTTSNRSGSARPVVVYLVTEDWYFLSHRLPMALAAQRAGYDVHVATRVNVNKDGAAIREYGFTLHPLNWRRGSFRPAALFSIVRDVRRLYRTLKPNLVHHVALQPSLIGSLAAAGLPIVRINALAGLGYGFTSGTWKARFLRLVLAPAVRFLLGHARSAVLVQNPDDRAVMEALGIFSDRIFLVAGSGVDVEHLTPLPQPAAPITAAFVGRLLADKGLGVLMEAHDLLVKRGEDIRLLVAGERDPANPASFSESQIERWRRRPGVEFLGQVADIREIWSRAHVAVLPSRREGLPKSLLEAAAFGRPIVATDVPGCREIARENVNALLVPADDVVALAEAIARLAHDAELRRRFATQGRAIVEREFSSERVGTEIVAIYDRLLGHERQPLPDAAVGR